MIANSEDNNKIKHKQKTWNIHYGSDILGIIEILHFYFPSLECHKQSRTQQNACYCIQEYDSYSSWIRYTIANVGFVMFVDTQFLKCVKVLVVVIALQ